MENKKKVLLILFLIMCLVAFLMWWFWSHQDQSQIPDSQEKTELSPGLDGVHPIVSEIIPYNEQIYQEDSDLDGLSNVREQELATNPNSNDSDNDGLFDQDEIEIWQTDPSRSDSDGDGFADGFEVLHGYKPNGSGSLEQ